MVTIRLSRQGKRNNPFYRIVVIDHTKKLGGKALDVVGFWHPAKGERKIDKEKISTWVSKGAKISPAVSDLIK